MADTKLEKAAHDLPGFAEWFAGSHMRDEGGRPKVFYRGVRRGAQRKGYLHLESFTDSPDIASIYAGTPGDPWSSSRDGAKAQYKEGASVHPVYLSIKEPLHLDRHQTDFGTILEKLQYGQPDGITHEEATKILNYLINRKAGKVKAGDFEYRAYDEDGEHELEDEMWSLTHVHTGLHQIRSDFNDSAGDHAEAMRHAERLSADTFAFVDAPRFKDVAQRLGYDGVVHDDVLAAKHVAPELLNKPAKQVQGLNDTYGGDHIHKTYRPFHPHQVVPLHTNALPQPSEEAPPMAPVAKTEDEKAPDAEGLLTVARLRAAAGRTDVALVLVSDGQGRYLFGKRQDNGRWTLPGGHLNPGESPEDGAKRELLEEAALVPSSLTFLSSQPLHDGAGTLYCFSALASGTPHGRRDPDQECAKWEWVDCRGGVPKNVYNKLHGPDDDTNVVRRAFELKRSERVWLDAGFADLRKATGIPGSYWAGTVCLYDDAESCPDIDCEHNQLAKALPKTETCGWAECEKQATSRVLWAEGMAYQPACDDHISSFEKKFGDDYSGTRPIKLAKMAIKDIPPGREVTPHEVPDNHFSNGIFHDYTHALSPEAQQGGYRLHVFQGPPEPVGKDSYHQHPETPLHAHLTDSEGESAGYVYSYVQLRPHSKTGALKPTVVPHESQVEDDHRGQGLGQMMYEALYAHAMHHLGATRAEGGEHSDSAMFMHSRLAAKHGLKYRPVENPDGPTGSGPDDNGAWESWRYRLKSELSMTKAETEVATLLAHPDPRERSLALKLATATPADIATGILDPDPQVWRVAFHHPDAAHALSVLATSTRDASGAPLFDRHDTLLADPRCHGGHVESMHRATTEDGDLHPDARRARLDLLRAHPLSAGAGRLLKSAWAHKEIAQYSVPPTASAASEEVMPHVKHLEETYRHHVLGGAANGVDAENGDLHQSGCSAKAVYKVPMGDSHRRFMVKPYAEIGDVPLSGWNETTSQALYHAGGIGHLHQQSFVAPHGHGNLQVPVVVIHLEDGEPVYRTPRRIVAAKNPELAHDFRRIALMDFLTQNSDRHGGNMLVRPNGKPLAIDHGYAFDYRDNWSESVCDRASDGGLQMLPPEDGDHPNIAYADALKWWAGASPDVRRAFDQRLGLLPAKRAAEMKRHFDARADWLDAQAKASEAGTLRPDWWYDNVKPAAPMTKALKDADFLTQERPGVNHCGFPLPQGDFNKLAKAHPPTVDHAYFETNLNAPEQEHAPTMGHFTGVEPKAVYSHGDRHYLVKPSNGAWTEMTSQALYHAAGIGHLHQQVHVSYVSRVPATVIHMAPEALTWDQAASRGMTDHRTDWLVDHEPHRFDLQRIGLMDLATHNFDRHSSNIMVHPDGRPLAIDHGQAFFEDHQIARQQTPMPDAPDAGIQEDLDSISKDFGSRLYATEALRLAPLPETDMHPLWDWWDGAKSGILKKYKEHLNMLNYDKYHRDTMQRVLEHRLGLIDELRYNSGFAAAAYDGPAATGPLPSAFGGPQIRRAVS